MRETNKTKRVIKIRIKNPLIVCRSIAILIILVWGVVLLINSCRNLTELQDIDSNKLTAGGYTIENNIEEILQVREFVWDKLSVDRRLELLQTIANVETHELGVNKTLKLVPDHLEQNTLGCYSDYDHIIKIDIEHLANSRSHDVLKTILHECRHAYQHEIVNLLDKTKSEYQNLYLFRDAQQFKKGFKCYDDDTVQEYWYNPVEIDARSYAEIRIKTYYDVFAKYS